MAISKQFRVLTPVVVIALLAIGATHFGRSHVRAAKSINIGDSASAVHELLGEPTATVHSIKNLNEIFPPTASYKFRTLEGEWIESDNIDIQTAEWFDLGSAGYLVIYNANGVTRTIWGGT